MQQFYLHFPWKEEIFFQTATDRCQSSVNAEGFPGRTDYNSTRLSTDAYVMGAKANWIVLV